MDNNIDCQVDPLPTNVDRAAGVNTMICGGEDYDNKARSSCWRLNPSGTWAAGEDMLEKRKAFTMTAIREEVIVIGGTTTYNVALKSVLKYSLKNLGGWSKMKEAPLTIDRHCTVKFNTSHLMFTGGSQNLRVI